MRRILIAVCGAALGAALFAPQGASAAVNCINGAGGNVQITVDGTSTQVSLDRSGASIRAFDGGIGGTDECATAVPQPTVTNTDTITVTDMTASTNSTLLVSLQGGPFTPGANDPPPPETVGPEIEITFVAGPGTDRIEVEGHADNPDDIDLGQMIAVPGSVNANLNAASEGGTPDCNDINATDVENVVVRGRGGDDNVNATACDSVTGIDPLDPGSLRIEGGNQNDFLRGGPGADTLLGGTQDDNVNGGAGDDSVDGERDNDKVDGGTGADTIEGGTEVDRVLYDDRTTALTATIGNGGADDGGSEDQSGGARDNIGASVEHFTGGSAGDSVTGSSVRNVINGGLGDDFLLGGEGNDDVEGEGGNDTLDGGGGKDDVRGGDGSDTGRGGSGADDIRGGAAADKLFGGPGADFVKGDKGKDSMVGQDGNDKIAAKDKKKDTKINCGAGKAAKESATVDKVDPKAKSC